MAHWSNWSGKIEASPIRIETPANEAAVQACVADAAEQGQSIRVVGASHSHSPLVATDGLMLDIEDLNGLVSVDHTRMEARVRAATRIHALGLPLREAGVALLNQGDIDRQALAGAVATGTHGTGPTLQNLSAGVVGVRMVLANAEVVECDATNDPDLFAAARLGLGALGVVTELRLRVRDAYRLEERMWAEELEPVLERVPELVRATRHFEYFWLPGKPMVACKALAETTAQARYPLEGEGARLAWSYDVLANQRNDKHTEMEYSLPVEAGIPCFRALRSLIEERFPDLAWPVEYRTLAADDVWMSTAYQRDTATLSVHQGADQPHQQLFDACEDIFRDFDGRPHWGKAHGRRGADLAALHARWDDWWQVRDRADPDARFMNAHLRELRGQP